MEECKSRARDAGLSFDDETLEYIVSNRDMLELSPKVMIPTLYDYWVYDVEVLKEYGKYKAYPSNPYETVINTRPAISFYNDNNPDWMNIMIFYHVLGHIDFFQNNVLFRHTWDDDFAGQALADKRMIANLRSEHNRWVDYIIEFSRSLDNITGYYSALAGYDLRSEMEPSGKLEYYFDVFLQEIKKKKQTELYKEILRYNNIAGQNEEVAEHIFFSEVKKKYPEFEAMHDKYLKTKVRKHTDLLEFIRDNSPYLQREENAWKKSVMTIIRNTAQYFAPQIRSKTINEGWASYWHDTLFRSDPRIGGHESGYAKLNAGVTSISRVGLNPYAIGLRLIQYVEELANKGKLSYDFQEHQGIEYRKNYDQRTGTGRDAIFELRKNFSDFMLVNTFVDQEFVDKHKLFVTGRRLNQQRGTVEYYVKSRKAKDYKQMLLDSFYHPPVIDVVAEKTNDDNLYLSHRFEKKQLIQQFISDVLIGIEYLWGGQVQLETTEIVRRQPVSPDQPPPIDFRHVLYTAKDRKISKMNI